MELSKISHYFYNLFRHWNWSESTSTWANLFLNVVILFLFVVVLNWIIRKILRGFLIRVSEKTITKFDDYLYHNNSIAHFSNLLSLFIFRSGFIYALEDFDSLKDEANSLISITATIILVLLIRSLLLTCRDFLNTLNSFKNKPIESYIQVVMIFMWCFGFVIIFSILTGKSVWQFLTALGALSAIILLIFKDTILGFVASIQVSVNDTVRIGDWITMSKYDADGDVTEINLSSVKVRNFDNTITTIPTYYLISDSFKNWRGMNVSGGRRIKRAVIIKAASIHFLTPEEVDRLKEIQLLTNYIETREADIQKFNKAHQIDKKMLINGRNLTNFGVFRKYLDSYLEKHPAINKDMIMMSRQLEPTAHGIPLEIYAFSSDKVWKNYEHIIGDIFDHLLAAIPYFNLELYELPTGKDFSTIRK